LSKIFFLDHCRRFGYQWKHSLLGSAKVFGHRDLHGSNEVVKKIVLQHNDLWFDIKMHYAKSYRPFELFVNENYKL